MTISWDTETTGIDLYHTAKPFFVTFCDGDVVSFYEWEVNPKTREVKIPKGDRCEILDRLAAADELVAHNAKFDITALAAIGIEFHAEWYPKLHDTLYMGHLLDSSAPHDLTSMALYYLRLDIQSFEDNIVLAANEARAIARRDYPTWKIARSWDEDPDMPSAGGKLAKHDMWLPRVIAKTKKYPKEHEWHTVLQAYSNTDSEVTHALWDVVKQECINRDLWKVYEERRKLIKVIYNMERRGVTVHLPTLLKSQQLLSNEAQENEKTCIQLSEGKLDKLPKSGTSKAMRELLFKKWKLPVLAASKKTGEPSVDKNVLSEWCRILPENTQAGIFVRQLQNKRKRDTAVGYMSSYARFGVPHPTQRDIVVLHPSLNATGSHTLRMSSSNPNEQNIGKQKDDSGFSIRSCFGPAAGREWWSLDFSNLELTLPAYEANEVEMIALFERPDDPPYFGSQHLLNASVLWPKEFQECIEKGWDFKSKYKATLYQQTKNGGFAINYGAQEAKADTTFKQKGAYKKLKAKFAGMEKLNQECIRHANEHGFVWTMPDRHIGSGYPIRTPRGFDNSVKPTIPLNFRVQGTAMWCMCRAMVRVSEYLESLVLDCYITMQIHDELVIDMPKGKTPTTNLPKVKKIKHLMEESGRDIGVPLRVEYSYHPNNWATDESNLLEVAV